MNYFLGTETPYRTIEGLGVRITLYKPLIFNFYLVAIINKMQIFAYNHFFQPFKKIQNDSFVLKK